MKKILKVTALIIVIIFIGIQFIRPEKNLGEEIPENQITAKYEVPENVQQILNVSCYDCHSNTTHYPWYSNIQPIAWWLNDHIVEGKKELNFSTFMDYPVWRQYKKFKEISKEIHDGEMPLTSFTLAHRDAILSADQKLTLEKWAANIMKEMESQYPPEGLVKPK